MSQRLNFTVCLLIFHCASSVSAAPLVVRDDDFSTNTRSDYTDLGIYFLPDRVAGDWTVSGGVLDVAGGAHGMLAIEDTGGSILPTPDHFQIAFSFTPSPIDSQDHPGIAFDRNGTNTRVFYLRTHSDQAVARFTTSPNSISSDTTVGTSGLAVGTSYDLEFDVDYLTQVASVNVFPLGGGPLITSATVAGANFVSHFGTNSGGAFGLLAFDTEDALIDNLTVTDFTQQAVPIPEPSTVWLFVFTGTAAARRCRRAIRRA